MSPILQVMRACYGFHHGGLLQQRGATERLVASVAANRLAPVSQISGDHNASMGYKHPEPERYAQPPPMHMPKAQSMQPERYNMGLGLNSPAFSTARLMGDSHTSTANSGFAAHGCYRVVGPARISKRGDCLVAHLFRGSRLELLDRHGNATPLSSDASMASMASIGSLASMASMTEEDFAIAAAAGAPEPGAGSGASPDQHAYGYGHGYGYDECVAECVLVAAHVELCGSACSMDLVDLSVQPAVHHHNGHTYVSVRSLPPEAVIQLDAGADLRHPINVTPPDPAQAHE